MSAAWTPLPYLVIRGQLSSSLQLNPGEPSGSDSSYYGEPALAIRLQTPLNEQLHVGFEIDTSIVGRAAPSIAWDAISPTFRIHSAYQLSERTWLGAHLGFSVDNSAQALDDPTLVLSGDRVLLSASSFNAIPLAIGLSHRIEKTELLSDFSASFLVGKAAPPLSQSPISWAIAARYHFTQALAVDAGVDISLSANPNADALDTLQPTLPRVSALIGFKWRPFLPKKKSADSAQSETLKQAADSNRASVIPLINRGTFTGIIVDEAGLPISDVEVFINYADSKLPEPDADKADADRSVTPELSYQQVTRSDAEGRFEFKSVPLGQVTLRTATIGYDSASKEVAFETAEQKFAELTIYPAVPAGEVKGRVLSLSGQGLKARISISPGNKKLETGEDGSFSLELKPGRYTLIFRHKNYGQQRRTIYLKDRGVVVLDIALSR